MKRTLKSGTALALAVSLMTVPLTACESNGSFRVASVGAPTGGSGSAGGDNSGSGADNDGDTGSIEPGDMDDIDTGSSGDQPGGDSGTGSGGGNGGQADGDDDDGSGGGDGSSDPEHNHSTLISDTGIIDFFFSDDLPIASAGIDGLATTLIASADDIVGPAKDQLDEGIDHIANNGVAGDLVTQTTDLASPATSEVDAILLTAQAGINDATGGVLSGVSSVTTESLFAEAGPVTDAVDGLTVDAFSEVVEPVEGMVPDTNDLIEDYEAGAETVMDMAGSDNPLSDLSDTMTGELSPALDMADQAAVDTRDTIFGEAEELTDLLESDSPANDLADNALNSVDPLLDDGDDVLAGLTGEAESLSDALEEAVPSEAGILEELVQTELEAADNALADLAFEDESLSDEQDYGLDETVEPVEDAVEGILSGDDTVDAAGDLIVSEVDAADDLVTDVLTETPEGATDDYALIETVEPITEAAEDIIELVFGDDLSQAADDSGLGDLTDLVEEAETPEDDNPVGKLGRRLLGSR